MRIWIVQTGEQLSTDLGPPRLLRSALLARELAGRGHEVTMFVSTFNHQQKYQRAKETASLGKINGHETIALRGCSYTSHVSWQRVLSQRQTAREFRRIAPGLDVPDVIQCGYPTIEVAVAVTSFGIALGVPVIIDCRDMWPDIFANHLSPLKKLLASPLLLHWAGQRDKAMCQAKAISGISDAFVEWGVKAAGRKQGPYDRAFHLAIDPMLPLPSDMAKAQAYWNQKLTLGQGRRLLVAFVGTVSGRMDLGTIIRASIALPQHLRDKLLFVICGRGDNYGVVEALAAGQEHIVMGGWRDAAEIRALLQQAAVGLLPYPNDKDFLISYPNKVGEYLSFGLPVLTSLEGITGAMLREGGAVIAYDFGNVESAKNMLAKLANQQVSLEKLRAAASKLFNKHFDSQKIYNDYADYIENLTGAL